MIKDNGCFVCGPDNLRGLQASFEIDPASRSSLCRLTIPDPFQGWKDVVHGGILATLLDEACVHACRTVGPHPVTAELTVRYRKPVPTGAEIVVRAEVTGSRGRVLWSRASVEVDGDVHAEAQSRIVLLQTS